MSIHYNAFISYRHAPLDIKVAAEVQKQLERFRIPTAIRKQTGIRRIDRIFRDKEELSLTSDLNETIETALQNADFLIVICSRSTKDSIWVQREIEFFLKTHDRKRILTVVAEGEPTEVVPEILLYQQMELTAEDGTIQKVQVPIEPLSCDYRMPFSKACREELPRLAAALLGCSYDDLRRRQRQYRTTRLAIASAAVILGLSALSVYYVWSAAQIQENYEQALWNQSEYLASESQKTLNEGDRLTAMLLAIHGLPAKEEDRPVVPNAIRALADASYAYKAPGSNALSLDRSFTHPETVRGYVADWERQRLITYGNYKLFVWDMQSGKELFSQIFDSAIRDVRLWDDGSLIVVTEEIFRLNSEDFSVLWQTADYGTHRVLFRSDGSLLLVSDHCLYLIDKETGKSLQNSSLEALLDEANTATIHVMAVSPDDRFAAVSLNTGPLSSTTTVIWNLETNELVSNDTEFDYIHAIQFLPDGGLVVSGYPKEYDENLTFYNRGAAYHFLFAGREQLLCMEPDGTVRWAGEVRYPQQFYGQWLLPCNYLEKPAVVCAVGNIAEVIDAANGTVLARFDLPAPMVSAETNDTRFRCILQNGQLAAITYTNGTPMTQEAFVGNLTSGRLSADFLVQAEGEDRVLLYRWGVYDETWQTVVEDNKELLLSPERCTTENGIVILKDGTFYFCSETKPLWFVSPEEAEDARWKLLGPGADGSTVAALERTSRTMLFIDETTGAMTERVLTYELNGEPVYDGKKLYYYAKELPGVVMADQEGETFLQSEELADQYLLNLLPNGDGTEFLLWNYDKEFMILSQQTLIRLSGTAYEKQLLWQPDGSGFVTADEKTIYLCDRDLQCLTQIPCDGKTVKAMQIHDGQLLVVYDTQKLYRYEAGTGNYLGSTDLGSSDNSRVEWDFSQPGRLALLLDMDLNLIDLSSWQMYTFVEDCLGCLHSKDQIFVRGFAGTDSYCLGLFRLSDYKELIRRAEAALGELELTSEQKTKYGIE